MSMQTNTGRIKIELKRIRDKPDKNFKVSLAEDNLMDWYVLYSNLDDPRFLGGEYILHIKLHDGYPHKAPDFRWLTPNGRFEINTKICYNISTYHENDSGGGGWNPLWTLNSMIIGIMSMLFDNDTNGIGHIHGTKLEAYQKFAKESLEFNKLLNDKYKFNF